ncbi:MAG: YkgJ family cysteine cluster protein [Candidatus Woesearchaeota archaeon]
MMDSNNTNANDVNVDKEMNFEGISNIKLVNSKKVFNCTQCGECCHIRESDKGITSEQEEKYRHYMFNKFGIIYLAKLNDITINIWPEEAEALKNEAKKANIDIDILPKRVVYDKKNHELIILDYFINHDVCPFFNKKTRQCGVYLVRPIICRSYPLLTTTTLGKCKYKLTNPTNYDSELTEATKLELMINKQKSILKSMIDNGDIVIPESITDIEMDNILQTARFKELRIMDSLNENKNK